MSSSPKCADVLRRLVRETTLLLLCALLPAVLAAWLHPRGAFRPKPATDDIAKVDPATVRRWTGPVLWIDARPAAAFATAHIPGALNLTERDWETRLGDVVARWRPDLPVVVYCDGAGCDASLAVARRLRRELQIDRIHVLAGGWEAWRSTAPP